MPVEIRVPQLGESVVEATVGKWLKREGEPVVQGDPVVELETEKVNLEVPAEESGVLARIHHREGETVRVGDVLGVLDETGDGPRPAAQEERAAAPPPPAPAEEAVATPVARRLAAEHEIDLAALRGTGPGARITQEDVLRYLEQRSVPAPTAPRLSEAPTAAPPPAPPPAPAAPAPPRVEAPAGAREERIRMTRRRQTIARRLVEAQHTAAMLTTFNEVDLSAVMEVRRRRRESFRERHSIGLGFMSFFTKAVVGALKAYPVLNAEIQGDEIVYKHYYDIGIAIATDEGLVVPVVRDADRLTFADIERRIEDLANRARSNTLTLQDLEGGTFTITNGGVFGSLLSTPILNPPQAGILGMHKIEDRPIAQGGQVVIRPMMYVALTYDHRLVDGREAVRFLVRIKELVEDPETLLLEG